jgi:hypothetical protein
MATPDWPWARLPRHAAVIERLRELVVDAAEWRWLEVCCSLAADRGDDLSDIDAGIGYAGDIDEGELETAGLALVRRCGGVIDVLAHVMPGWPPETRRFAVEFDAGVQLDLVLMPSTRRSGLPTGAVAVVDKDRRLATPWQPPGEDAPSAALAREWLMLGWWALSDVAKYLHRNSLYEAVERLVEARHQALRLYAVGQGTPFPSFGLVSLLDFPPYEVPEQLPASYALPQVRATVLAAALVVGRLLDSSAAAAGEALGATITTRWTDTARARLEALEAP